MSHKKILGESCEGQRLRTVAVQAEGVARERQMFAVPSLEDLLIAPEL